MKKIFFLIATLLLSIGIVVAQDEKSQIDQERQQIQKELAELERTYKQIKGQRNVTLSQLNLLKRKIETQERYLNNINREIRVMNDNIYRSTLEIGKMQKQLDTLKAQYARSVVYAYKNRST